MGKPARQGDLLADIAPKPKRRRRVLAHVTDMGEGTGDHPFGASYKCPRCGWQSGWLCSETESEMWRGVPCEVCNSETTP